MLHTLYYTPFHNLLFLQLHPLYTHYTLYSHRVNYSIIESFEVWKSCDQQYGAMCSGSRTVLPLRIEPPLNMLDTVPAHGSRLSTREHALPLDALRLHSILDGRPKIAPYFSSLCSSIRSLSSLYLSPTSESQSYVCKRSNTAKALISYQNPLPAHRCLHLTLCVTFHQSIFEQSQD